MIKMCNKDFEFGVSFHKSHINVGHILSTCYKGAAY